MSESIPEFKFALTEKLIKVCQDQGEDPNKWLPTKSESLASGWDVRCAAPIGVKVSENGYSKISLGFQVFAPSGWWLKLVPRSSTFVKKHLHALYGTIDESYSGEMFFCCQFIPCVSEKNVIRTIPFGERIGQLIPVKRQEMKVTSITQEELKQLVEQRQDQRGSGGFGSTGDA